VVAGTATAVAGGVRNRQAGKAEQAQDAQADEQQQAMAQQAAAQQAMAAPAPAPASESDMISQLKQLAELKDQGILTDEEFAAQKAKILG